MISYAPEERRNLAKFMKHSSDVQASFYDRSVSAVTDARMSLLVSGYVKGKHVTEEMKRPRVRSTCFLYLLTSEVSFLELVLAIKF